MNTPNNITNKFRLILPILLFAVIGIQACQHDSLREVNTEVAKWQDNKKGAVTITFDDGTINHFRVALPLLDSLDMPATFYIITGAVPDSEYKPEFVGRPVDEIIEETAVESTNEENFFERASAIRYLGFEDVYDYHVQAGQFYEQGNVEQAHEVIDQGYANVRAGEYTRNDDFTPYLNSVLYVEPGTDLITWEELRTFDGDFFEFGSHTVTHPYLSVMDEDNILFELEKSKLEIHNQLGPEHTFSAEAPFGTEDERVMEYLYDIYPANRNRMPEPFLDELNRSSQLNPGASNNEYVQWQRGPLTDTSMELKKSWVDTTLSHDNIWLTLVYHGIDDIGWEPITHEELDTYYRYIKERENDLWIATFEDVAKYIRQRMNSELVSETNGEEIFVNLSHSLGDVYDLPLTLKTDVPDEWNSVLIEQGNRSKTRNVQKDGERSWVIYQASPNAEEIRIAREES